MMRLLFWGLAGWLLYLGIRKLGRGGDASLRQPGSRGHAEDMVRCVTCGLNLPKSEALPFEGRWVCCAEHARNHQPAVHP